MEEVFTNFIGGFARIFFVSFIVWMIGLVVLLFRELFNQNDFSFKDYLYKVWKLFILSFEFCGYGGIIVGAILLIITEDYLVYSMVTIAATILSIIYFTIRRRTGGFSKDQLKKEK